MKFLEVDESFNSISDKISEYDIPALSLAVINGDKIEWEYINQNANFQEEQKLDCASIFRAASLCKQVTFLSAFRMHSAGEIDLESILRLRIPLIWTNSLHSGRSINRFYKQCFLERFSFVALGKNR